MCESLDERYLYIHILGKSIQMNSVGNIEDIVRYVPIPILLGVGYWHWAGIEVIESIDVESIPKTRYQHSIVVLV